MKVTQAIENKCFILWLEGHLLDENSTIGNLTFEEFSSQIWRFLCRIPVNILFKISSQLGLKRDKNIGNVSEKIYQLLGLTYLDSKGYQTLIF